MAPSADQRAEAVKGGAVIGVVFATDQKFGAPLHIRHRSTQIAINLRHRICAVSDTPRMAYLGDYILGEDAIGA